jgi:FkbH-like protein
VVRERADELVCELEKVSSHPLPQDLNFIKDIADEFYRGDENNYVSQFVDQISCRAPVALQWIKGCFLELQGRYDEASALLDSITILESSESEAVRLQALCRDLTSIHRWGAATIALKESTRRASSLALLLGNERLLSRINPSPESASSRHLKLAILGNANFDILARVLRICAFAQGIELNVFIGPYDQHRQQILGACPELEKFGPSAVLIAADWRSLGLFDRVAKPDDSLLEFTEELRGLWHRCRQRFGAQIIQENYEVPLVSAYGRLDFADSCGRGRLIQRLNLELWKLAQSESGIHILDMDYIASDYGKSRWDDPSQWYATKQYPALEAIPTLARHLVSLLRPLTGYSSKCLALDLDGTLWGGVIGEDGIDGIRLGGSPEGEAYVAFQRYVKSLKSRGIILAVCSKNNEEDAKSVFRSHPEMLLSLDDFSAFNANWAPKDESLRMIAQFLNIGLDSIVFVDDSPLERSWIRRRVPEVEVPEMPADPADYVNFLHRQMYFELIQLTEDDSKRAEYYRTNEHREQLRRRSETIDDFLLGLNMMVELRPFDRANLPRITQLINKTNQFNLTAQRLGDVEVSGLISNPNYYTQFMRVRDRFGDNGITGILIALRDGDTLKIENWLMSCRVLGRKLEEVMFAAVSKYARSTNCTKILGIYRATSKNEQVAGLYGRLGFSLDAASPEGDKTYSLSAGDVGTSPEGVLIEDFTQDAERFAAKPV